MVSSLIIYNLDDERQQNIQQLIKETKRLVIAVIQIQAGSSLLETLEAPVTPKEEELFASYLSDERIKLSKRVESHGNVHQSSGSMQYSNDSISPLSNEKTIHLYANADGSR